MSRTSRARGPFTLAALASPTLEFTESDFTRYILDELISKPLPESLQKSITVHQHSMGLLFRQDYALCHIMGSRLDSFGSPHTGANHLAVSKPFR